MSLNGYMLNAANVFRQYQLAPPDSPGPYVAAYLAYWLSPPLGVGCFIEGTGVLLECLLILFD